MRMSEDRPTVDEILEYLERMERGTVVRLSGRRVRIEDRTHTEGLVLLIEFTDEQMDAYIDTVSRRVRGKQTIMDVVDLDLSETAATSEPENWPIILHPDRGFGWTRVTDRGNPGDPWASVPPGADEE